MPQNFWRPIFKLCPSHPRRWAEGACLPRAGTRGSIKSPCPWVIHSFGGGRDALEAGHLDGTVSCHYRLLPLLYARESDLAIKNLGDGHRAQ